MTAATTIAEVQTAKIAAVSTWKPGGHIFALSGEESAAMSFEPEGPTAPEEPAPCGGNAGAAGGPL